MFGQRIRNNCDTSSEMGTSYGNKRCDGRWRPIRKHLNVIKSGQICLSDCVEHFHRDVRNVVIIFSQRTPEYCP